MSRMGEGSSAAKQGKQGGGKESESTPAISEVAGQVSQQLRDVGGQVREAATQRYEQVRDVASQRYEQLRDSASEYYEQGRERAREWEQSLESYVQEKPVQALLMAAGVGVLLGLLWKRS